MIARDAGARNQRAVPRVGDTFRFGALWVVVDSAGARTVLRLIRPGIRETTTEVVLPLPRAMVPTPWTRQDLAYARSRVLPRLRKGAGR